MLKSNLIEFFERDLRKLIDEINLYANEADLWIIKEQISNSAGNLTLHLIGNLNHFIGATLGNTGYVRQRELEFSNKNIPKTELIQAIEKVIVVVKNTLQNFPDADFSQDFPLEKHGKMVSNAHMLLHLLTHLSYHLGQINYHRRLLA